jgi:hypothetical protein
MNDNQDHYRAGLLKDVANLKPAPIETNNRNGSVATMSLDEARAVFRKWLGAEYDMDAFDAVVATGAAERLDGDPLWLLLLSGPGNAKTETVQALAGAGATVISTISSDAALLSGTPAKQKAKGATGGLLRAIGERGVLVVKDVTSILSMDNNIRGTVLAAFREIHDGRWTRNLGTDGGLTLEWTGRLVVVGAVTTAWDRAHSAVATMGDRFVILRMDSTVGRPVAGRRSLDNVGSETTMRAELAAAVAGVLANVDPAKAIHLEDDEVEAIVAAADLVTRARTSVEYDYKGNVIDSDAPEMPTRFAKQLAQVVRGAVAVGMDRDDALRLSIRCARDSTPPLRLALIDDIAANPHSTASDSRKRLEKPWSTVDRQLQSLHMLGVLACDEEPPTTSGGKTRWRYSLAGGIDATTLTLKPSPEKLVAISSSSKREG